MAGYIPFQEALGVVGGLNSLVASSTETYGYGQPTGGFGDFDEYGFPREGTKLYEDIFGPFENPFSKTPEYEYASPAKPDEDPVVEILGEVVGDLFRSKEPSLTSPIPETGRMPVPGSATEEARAKSNIASLMLDVMNSFRSVPDSLI